MKKIVVTLVLAVAVSAAFATPPVSEKVLKTFQDAFPAVQNAKWYEFENYYQVYFDTDDVKCRIKYDFDGKVIGTIRYYGEKMLCPFLKIKLARKFPGKKIFGVTEISSDNEITYDCILEDDKSWMRVLADATGGMTVSEKFKKAAE